jgi:NarL family two-component system response regulator LiaR
MDLWRDRAGVHRMASFVAQHFGVAADVQRSQRQERKSRVVHPTGLSEREVDVLRLLGSGRTNQQIADDLFISLNTVSHHLRSIFGKTGTSNRTEAACFAHQHGLTTGSPRDPSTD